jgi:uncharacterized protein (TIGR03000 family)
MRRHLLLCAALILAVLCLFVTPQPSQAQVFRDRVYFNVGVGQPYYYGYSPWYSSYYYPRSWGFGMYPYRSYYYSPAYATEYYSPPNYSYTYPNNAGYTSQPTYSTQTSDEDLAENPNAIRVRVNVPENARVWFENQETQQRGTDRLFVSPPLEAGKDYVYHIKAQWMENGRPVVRSKEIIVHAGDRVTIDMTTAPVSTGEAIPRPQTRRFETNSQERIQENAPTQQNAPSQQTAPARGRPTAP